MGRGRQKAKHTKVARDLKYFSPDTNYNALERELGGGVPNDPKLDEDLAAWPEYVGTSYGSADASAPFDEDDDEAAEDDDDVAQNRSA